MTGEAVCAGAYGHGGASYGGTGALIMPSDEPEARAAVDMPGASDRSTSGANPPVFHGGAEKLNDDGGMGVHGPGRAGGARTPDRNGRRGHGAAPGRCDDRRTDQPVQREQAEPDPEDGHGARLEQRRGQAVPRPPFPARRPPPVTTLPPYNPPHRPCSGTTARRPPSRDSYTSRCTGPASGVPRGYGRDDRHGTGPTSTASSCVGSRRVKLAPRSLGVSVRVP